MGKRTVDVNITGNMNFIYDPDAGIDLDDLIAEIRKKRALQNAELEAFVKDYLNLNGQSKDNDYDRAMGVL